MTIVGRRRSARRKGFVVGLVVAAIPSVIAAHLVQDMAFFARLPFVVTMVIFMGILASIIGIGS